MPTKLLLVFILLLPPSLAISNRTLVEAFGQVFLVRDEILVPNSRVMEKVVGELQILGVDAAASGLCNLEDTKAAKILMLAALGNFQLGLRDDSDWTIVVADTSSGRLVRQRSFSSVRFAVLEGMLLISIVALGRAIWLKGQ